MMLQYFLSFSFFCNLCSKMQNFIVIFPDRPVTYLYNTLHYYEQKLRDRPLLKRKLVSAVLGFLYVSRAPGWGLSKAYLAYMQSDRTSWIPDLDYYVQLIRRSVFLLKNVQHN